MEIKKVPSKHNRLFFTVSGQQDRNKSTGSVKDILKILGDVQNPTGHVPEPPTPTDHTLHCGVG